MFSASAIPTRNPMPEYWLLWNTQNLTKPSHDLKNNERILLTKTLAEKIWLLLLPKPLPRKDKPILKTLQSQSRTRPKPQNKANQNHCKPKRKPETLKPILATRQNQTETLPMKWKPIKQKAENLKTCLLKKYWPILLTWKYATAKNGFEFIR